VVVLARQNIERESCVHSFGKNFLKAFVLGKIQNIRAKGFVILNILAYNSYDSWIKVKNIAGITSS